MKKNKFYIYCIVEQNPYTFDLEIDISNATKENTSLNIIYLTCIDFIISNIGNHITNENIEVVMAKDITFEKSKLKSIRNIDYYCHFYESHFKKHKYSEIESLQNEYIKEMANQNWDSADLIYHDLSKIKDKLFNDFIVKMNFNHEGY